MRATGGGPIWAGYVAGGNAAGKLIGADGIEDALSGKNEASEKLGWGERAWAGGAGVVQVAGTATGIYKAGAAVAKGGAAAFGAIVSRGRSVNPGAPSTYLRDFATKSTRDWSAAFKSEGEARTLARTKLGTNPVEVEPGKWRSANGKWQYRAKPGDVADRHIHLEELNPETGEVLQNLHLRWPEGGGR